MKIIVNGVDGNFGSIVAKELLTKVNAENLIFTAPSESGLDSFLNSGATLRVANFNHQSSLVEAFKGGDVMLLISAPFVGKKRQQAHRNAINAAIDAGVQKIVYTSLVNASDPTNPSIEKIDHAYTEDYLVNQTKLYYNFMRNSQYAEAMITSYLNAAATSGVQASNQADGEMAYVSRKDCALAAAYALQGPVEEKRIFNINGAELMTLARFVEIGNQVTGKNVHYQVASDEETYAAFDAMGVPRTTDGDFKKDSPAPYSSEGMVTFGQAIREGKMNTFTEDFELLTGQKPVSVKAMFEQLEAYQVGVRNATDD
ncbi:MULTISPECIES: NmrA family NAD(P)-binding protein [unclassified Enterococcus]|uniref:NmrA family NAD(P)-binding protein n=1 Tax=unclassified Enterococcus TaxID=2608891 RepID=UPI001C130C21|nr:MULTISPECIES: NmrA family NAD(P)-binding protein [unclassified Enterococcus]